MMAITTPQLYLVTSCEKPKDIWDALRGHYERETLANKLFLKKRYFRKEMKESTSMETHLKEMKEITDKLASIGAPIAQEDQVVTLLGSLTQSYSTVVTAMEARSDLTLNYVQQALTHEEQNQVPITNGGIAPTQTQADSALVGAYRRDRSRKPPSCWKCGEVGHVQRFCPESRSDHKAKIADSELDGAFTVSSDPQYADKWYVDSGASTYMTSQLGYLTDYQTFDVLEKVKLGDGRVVEAVGAGNVSLKKCCLKLAILNELLCTMCFLFPSLLAICFLYEQLLEKAMQ